MNVLAKILIAAGDPAILSGTRRALEAAGYTTLTALDGETTLRQAKAQRPNLALLLTVERKMSSPFRPAKAPWQCENRLGEIAGSWLCA
jgi:PleD family two-component response regulator